MPERAEAAPDAVDVAAIMAEIRATIALRRRQGLRTPDEIEGLLEQRRRSYGELSQIDPGLLKQILEPSHDWNVAVDYPLRTRRSGLVGSALVLVKRLVRPIVRLYTDHVLKRQAQLNLYLMYFLKDATEQIVHLELEVARLRQRVEDLSRGQGQQ